MNVSSASRARHFVVQHLADHDLSYLTDDVQLVVSELATNALVHAQTPFTVSLRALERSVLLMVRDGATSGPMVVAPRSLDLGGRGLMIVQGLSRDWGVAMDTGGGKSVWAVFDTPSSASAKGLPGWVTLSGLTDVLVVIPEGDGRPAG